MPTTYNPVPILDTSFQYPSDGDAANVASIIIVLDLADAVKYFADLLDGTSPGVTLDDPTFTGTALAATLAVATLLNVGGGALTATSSAVDVGGGVPFGANGTLHVVDDADFDSDVNIDGSLQIDFALDVDGLASVGAINIDSGAIIADSSLFNFGTVPLRVAGPLTITSAGHIIRRPVTGANAATITYAVTDGDVIFAPTQSAPAIWTVSDAADGAEITITGYLNGASQLTSGTNTITLRNSDASSINCLLGGGAGSVASVDLMYRTSGKWQVVHKGLQ